MPAPPDAHAALRRFSLVWGLSVAVKIAAVAVLLFLILKFYGGF